jgi:hypothetical protein
LAPEWVFIFGIGTGIEADRTPDLNAAGTLARMSAERASVEIWFIAQRAKREAFS